MRRCLCVRGSSPLTRGKLLDSSGMGCALGLIPAHAGKTWKESDSVGYAWAHPRSRGENRKACRAAWLSGGSSPLTRGKPGHMPGRRSRVRLIPAHAGKTTVATACTRATTAHPRSRGENLDKALLGSATEGSSPLTRGKHHRRDHAGRGPGLIPAHAGKTPAALTRSCSRRAHPRSRGENASPSSSRNSARGSSPLTRGKPRMALYLSQRIGLIPAHAGKTQVDDSVPECRRAHPRSRGENAS